MPFTNYQLLGLIFEPMLNMLKSNYILLIVYVLSIIFIGCKGIRELSDEVFKPSAREVYARGFDKEDSLFLKWKSAFEQAKTDKLIIKEPFVYSTSRDSSEVKAWGYTLDLRHGDRLVIEVQSDSLSPDFFIDFYADSIVSGKSTASAESGSRSLTRDVLSNGKHKVIVQPQMNFEGNYKIKIYTQPSLEFPVAGKGNADVQSFWGADRDGGARTHEGVDIFAPRGTPLIAVTDGIIVRSGEYGRGGKQVWIRDGLFGNSIYYAHLDSINVSMGQQVDKGDTIGFVGNTGNAAATSPHLHFGIYTNRGAVDPYPFIRIREVPE